MRDAKLRRDSLWTYGGFAVQAGAGLGLQVYLAAAAGAESLGVFSQLLAVFLLGGQVFVAGLHDSAQRHVAESLVRGTSADLPATAAARLVAGTGALGAAILFAAAPALSALFDSESLGPGIRYLAPGVGLFCVNKVLLAVLNGRRRMIEMAAAQTVRAVGLVLAAVVLVELGGAPRHLGLVFTAAESAVLVFALVRRPFRSAGGESAAWYRPHLSYGIRALPHGLLSEAYLRLDVLVLGVFLSDARVGVYALAALFVEGLWTLASLARTLSNPLLVGFVTRREPGALAAFARRAAGWSFAVAAAAGGIIVLAFPLLSLVVDAPLVAEARSLFTILLGGILVYAPLAPVDQLLMQAGRPGAQSLLLLGYAGVNLVLNVVLVPRFGLLGAAAATVVSVVLAAGCLYAAASVVARSLRPGAAPGP